MNSSKKIEISKSTFVSLKAELLRKKDEVNKAKLDSKNKIENFVPSSKFESADPDPAKPSTSKKKEPIGAEEAEELRKSREALEKKSRLYDYLSQGSGKEENEELYLVNFDKKKKEETITSVKEDPLESSAISDKDEYPDSDDDWVDYVDSLGRTRRCLKTDVEHFRQQDRRLQDELTPRQTEDAETTSKAFVKEGDITAALDLQPPDAYMEQLRQQWEKKEQELLHKDKIHYEDVRFNEARGHGVGYYAFSGDEKERARQQAELLKVRRETEEARKSAEEARKRREQALQQRVSAARARQRARAGLPPEPPQQEPEVSVTSMLLDFVEEQKKASAEKAAEEAKKLREHREQEAKKQREQFIREWDVGKEALQERHREMSQEEWVEKKRRERPSEFAPPQALSGDGKKSKTFDQSGYFIDTRGNTNTESNKNLTWQDVRPNQTYSADSNLSLEPQDRSLIFTTKKQKTGNFQNSNLISSECSSELNLNLNLESNAYTTKKQSKLFDPHVNVPNLNFVSTPIVDECSGESESAANLTDNPVPGFSGGIKRQRKGAEIEPPSTYEYYGPVDKKGKKEKCEKTNVSEAFEMGCQYLQEKATTKSKKKSRALLEDEV